MARFGLLERLMQVVKLDLATDEPGQPAMCRQLQACAQRAETLHLVHNEGLGNAFDLGGPQSLEFEITLRQLVCGLAH
ncbi:hypothetical protein D9M72_562870 [compost metagenome]